MIKIKDRIIAKNHMPLVIVEIGINHEGQIKKALEMIDDAAEAGAECVKIQTHVLDSEMIPNDVIPGNADESIWEIMQRCQLTEREELELKQYAEEKGIIFLSTPFSRAAADRLEKLDLSAYKIGSGECNNYPLIKHIVSFGKPIILSTGMNDIESIRPAVEIIEDAGIDYALLHCTSIYPTPYEKVRLGAMEKLMDKFPKAVVGLSDHSIGNYTAFAAEALGASIIEKHFTSDKSWEGPDVPISIDPEELKSLIEGTNAIHQALGGSKEILNEEQPTIDFAYASVVTTKKVKTGETFTQDNIWVKRPGTGEVRADKYEDILGQSATKKLGKNHQLRWSDLE